MIIAGKLLALAYVAALALTQVPELRYDLGAKSPAAVDAEALGAPGGFTRSTFVSLRATPDFDRAFRLRTHGVTQTYFLTREYGERCLVCTYDSVTEDWRALNRLVGRLKPVRRQPFVRKAIAGYRERHGLVIPPDAYCLSLYDTPRVSAWQIAGVAGMAALWAALLYVFFLRRRRSAVRS